jgi:chromosome segregation ATPase
MIYQEVKNNLGYFLKLFRLGKKEGLTPENIISFPNMAENIQELSEQFQSHLNEVKALELRKNRCKEQLEDLEYRTMSTQEQLSDTGIACKQKFDELSVICSQVQMLEYKIEQFKNGQSYQAIEQITRDRVNELLADNKKLLEYALVSIIDALRDNPD